MKFILDNADKDQRKNLNCSLYLVHTQHTSIKSNQTGVK